MITTYTDPAAFGTRIAMRASEFLIPTSQKRITDMLLQTECSTGAASDARSRQLQELLHRRMSKPQRHRLLHGFLGE